MVYNHLESGDSSSSLPASGGDDGIGCCAADAYDQPATAGSTTWGSDVSSLLGNNFGLSNGNDSGTPVPRDTAGTDRPPAPAPTDQAPPGSDRTNGSLGEKIGQFMQKLGELLSQFVPQEYMQHVRGVLNHISEFLRQNLRDMNISPNPDGSTRVNFNLGTDVDVPGGHGVRLGSRFGFDFNNGANGPELNNITGVQMNGNPITGARFEPGPAGPAIVTRTGNGRENRISLYGRR